MKVQTPLQTKILQLIEEQEDREVLDVFFNCINLIMDDLGLSPKELLLYSLYLSQKLLIDLFLPLDTTTRIIKDNMIKMLDKMAELVNDSPEKENDKPLSQP